MIFLAGLLGFALGFLLGQVLLAWLLRDRSKKDLLNDPALRWRYGTLNWAVALAVMSGTIFVWERWVG